MSYEVNDEYADIRKLNEKIESLQTEVDGIPFQLEGVNTGYTTDSIPYAAKGSESASVTLQSIQDALGDTWTQIDDVLAQFTFDADNLVTGIQDALDSAIDTLIAGAGQLAADVATWVTDLHTNAATEITSFFADIEGSIETALGTTWTNIETFIGSITTSAASWLEGQSAAIETALGTTWTNLETFIGSITTSAATWLEGQGTAIETALGTAWTNIETFIGSITGTAADWLEARGTEIETALGTAWTNLNTFLGSITTSAASWLAGQGANIRTALGTAWTNLTTFLGSITGTASAWIQTQGSNIETALGTTWTALETFISGISNSAADWLEDRGTEIETALGDIWDSISGFFPSVSTAYADHETADNTIYVNPASTATSRIGDGDIDMKTWDIRRVDRIFFDSNDSIDSGSDDPHISGSLGNLSFFVPSTDSINMLVGTLAKLNITENASVFSTNLRITGTTAGTLDGTLWLDGTDLKAISGGSEVSFSDIGGGEGGSLTPETLGAVIDSLTIINNNDDIDIIDDEMPIWDDSASNLRQIAPARIINSVMQTTAPITNISSARVMLVANTSNETFAVGTIEDIVGNAIYRAPAISSSDIDRNDDEIPIWDDSENTLNQASTTNIVNSVMRHITPITSIQTTDVVLIHRPSSGTIGTATIATIRGN